jgi:succinylglutamic semialdehyde dehydrogenase
VLKPSSQAPLVAEFIIKLWESTGIPAGVVNLVQGGSDTGRALSEHPRLMGLFFTGSAATGKALHRGFGGFPDKILVLEMGGNNPQVVYEVSNPQAAAYLTVISAYITSGQRCSCARRLIVTEGRSGDDFLECLLEMVKKIKVGCYTESPEPFMGPVISKQSAEKLLTAQQRLVNAGGKILVEMRSQGEIINMLSPGLIDVTSVDKREDEELFGPLLQLIRVPDFDSAIRESNNTKYGLAASLLCDKVEFYEKFLGRIRAGVINWNRQTTGADASMPFGGVGTSGNHRPGAYFTADHCSYPVASIEAERIAMPDNVLPGINY